MTGKSKDNKGKNEKPKRKFVGVIFKCCNVYSRIYIDKGKDKFVGFCPKCGAKMEIYASSTGSKSNFFVTDK